MALTTIKTAAIADDAVTTDKLANAINTERTANTAKTSLEDNAVTLAKMAGGTDGQIITYDASGDPVAVGPGTDGQVLTSTGAGSPPAFEDAAAGGKILQVLQTVKTDVFSTNSTSYVAVTGLTQAITAASTSNKILINITLYGGNSGSQYAVAFKLAKDSTAMDGNTIGAASGNDQESGTFRFRNSADTHAEEASFMYLDTPADTNSHTYGLLMKVFNSSYYGRLGTTGTNGNYTQHMRCPCTITVMEVAA